jgi:uncharacterized membrane protein YeaQ/YmgE (transglycosylase-associated protein family)
MIATILWGVISGTVLGVLARMMLPGRNVSVWVTIGVGVAASLIGGVIAYWIGIGNTPGIDWFRHLLQVAFAVFFVTVAARVMASRPTSRPPRRPVS